MTKEDIKQICQIYDNFRSERDAATIAYNSDDTFWEHILATYNLSQPSLPSNLDEAAEENSKNYYCSCLENHNETGICDGCENMKLAFKAGAEWMAGQGWLLDGEVKDQPTGGGDFEIYLDYDRDKMENILDEICDYVNANYPDDDNRYKVIIQIRKKQ